MKTVVSQRLPMIAWMLGGGVTVLAFLAWGSGLQWEFGSLSPYQLFPLFGLLAFSLMWTHYVLFALRVWADDAPKVVLYAKVTWALVLMSLLAHPLLLNGALLADGLGLPPQSYAAYVGEALVWAALLGTVAWTAFMAYETKIWFQTKPWWRYVLGANALAMLLILVHSISLGSHLQVGWFRWVWYGYGATLLLAYGYLLARKRLFASA